MQNRRSNQAESRDTRIAYQEQTRVTAQVPDSTPVSKNPEDEEENPEEENPGDEEENPVDEEENLGDETPEEKELAKEEDHDSMGPLILDNMEISMVHVLPANFQSTMSQPSFLDCDVVAVEATQIDFVSTTGVEPTANDVNLKAVLAELFPRSSAVNLHHLKPLYVTAHIEG